MFSCPGCSYLKTLRKLSRSYVLSPSSGVGLQSSSQATWIHLSARRPSLVAYKRKENELGSPLPTTRRRRFLHTAAAQESSEAVTVAAEDSNPSPAVPKSFPSPSSSSPSSSSSSLLHKDILPICCPGCGAYAQTIDPSEPGYYSKTRKRTRKLLNQAKEALVTELKQSSSSSSEGTANEEKDAVIDTEDKNGSVEGTLDGKEENGSRDSTAPKGGAPPKPAGMTIHYSVSSASAPLTRSW
jgi:hypothetical protein